MCIYKYSEISFCNAIYRCISKINRVACTNFPLIYVVIQGESVYLFYTEQLGELPAILDSLFHGLVNTTSASIGEKGGG